MTSLGIWKRMALFRVHLRLSDNLTGPLELGENPAVQSRELGRNWD